MITILRNNRKLLRKRNPFQRGFGFEKLRKEYRTYAQGKLDSRPLSKRERQAIREKIEAENRKDTIKMTLVAILILIALLGLGIRLYGTFQRNQEFIAQKELASKTEQYLFYINDGDKWLNQQHWHNAIFQYLLAKNIFPNEYDVNYRLIMAYGGKCKFEGSGCTDGSELLAKLRRQFPNSKDLQPLEEMFISKTP
ncbi:MAG: hypothetical protein KDD31_10075 [Muricauda sp.]|nr:hypothetical protein [Allomuricauda sp.]